MTRFIEESIIRDGRIRDTVLLLNCHLRDCNISRIGLRISLERAISLYPVIDRCIITGTKIDRAILVYCYLESCDCHGISWTDVDC